MPRPAAAPEPFAMEKLLRFAESARGRWSRADLATEGPHQARRMRAGFDVALHAVGNHGSYSTIKMTRSDGTWSETGNLSERAALNGSYTRHGPLAASRITSATSTGWTPRFANTMARLPVFASRKTVHRTSFPLLSFTSGSARR